MRQIVHIWSGKTRGAERGDTLVEVLIAMVIVATVIGGAYAVSNRSLQSTRGAQERATALKLGEAQIEQLKGIISQAPDQIFGTTAPAQFCLTSDSTGTHVYDFTVAAQKVNCITDSTGAPAGATTQPAYTYNLRRTGNDFKFTESWTDITGRFTDSLQLNYRAYQ